MKIILFKKENDENVYFRLDSAEEKVLNFDSIKILATKVLSEKCNNQFHEVNVEIIEASLELYKTTLESVFKSIDEDDELLELFRKQTVPKDEKETNMAEESLMAESSEMEVAL